MTSGRLASSPRNSSAGGQELQPCDVKSSTTVGRLEGDWSRVPVAKLRTGSKKLHASRQIRRIDDGFMGIPTLDRGERLFISALCPSRWRSSRYAWNREFRPVGK